MKNLTFRNISNLEEAEKAWKSLSPNKVLYDDWDFRYTYYKYFNYPLNFIAGYDQGELVGLLPLMWDPTKGCYDFFAGFGYMEDNAIFYKPGYEETIPQFLEQLEGPAVLEYMRPDMGSLAQTTIHDYNYYIELAGMTNYSDFVTKYLDGDSRRNLNSQIRKLTENNTVEVSYDNVEDLKVLEYWNKIRFGNTSSFNERPHWDEFFSEIATKYPSKIITVTLNGEKQGVGFVLFYKNICYGINTGYNPEVKNLGKYITLLKIDAAIKERMKIYDAGGSGAFGWKTDFNLLKKPQYLRDTRSDQA
ncbi:MAG: GNAT family N-acetyltransferase [Patescibacteria group bacterium]